jgi:hypothetical protein
VCLAVFNIGKHVCIPEIDGNKLTPGKQQKLVIKRSSLLQIALKRITAMDLDVACWIQEQMS